MFPIPDEIASAYEAVLKNVQFPFPATLISGNGSGIFSISGVKIRWLIPDLIKCDCLYKSCEIRSGLRINRNKLQMLQHDFVEILHNNV